MTSEIPLLPLGGTFRIEHGNQVVTVNEVGGGLNSFTVDGSAVVDGPKEHARLVDVYRGGRGQVLLPWPNRVAHGSYMVDDLKLQLAVTEVGRGHAIHGFARFVPWQVVEHQSARVVLSTVLYAHMGYPFVIEATVGYSLDDHGLTVDMKATNRSMAACPFGMGTHPYVMTGSEHIDDDILQSPASSYLPVDDTMIPTGPITDVAGSALDFREPRSLARVKLDTPFTGLERDARGRATVTLTGASGARSVSVWMDEAFDHLMLFTGDTLSEPAERRRSIAIEPMTCAPDAFNNGMGLRLLDPGETATGSWGITAK